MKAIDKSSLTANPRHTIQDFTAFCTVIPSKLFKYTSLIYC